MIFPEGGLESGIIKVWGDAEFHDALLFPDAAFSLFFMYPQGRVDTIMWMYRSTRSTMPRGYSQNGTCDGRYAGICGK